MEVVIIIESEFGYSGSNLELGSSNSANALGKNMNPTILLVTSKQQGRLGS